MVTRSVLVPASARASLFCCAVYSFLSLPSTFPPSTAPPLSLFLPPPFQLLSSPLGNPPSTCPPPPPPRCLLPPLHHVFPPQGTDQNSSLPPLHLHFSFNLTLLPHPSPSLLSPRPVSSFSSSSRPSESSTCQAFPSVCVLGQEGRDPGRPITFPLLLVPCSRCICVCHGVCLSPCVCVCVYLSLTHTHT